METLDVAVSAFNQHASYAATVATVAMACVATLFTCWATCDTAWRGLRTLCRRIKGS